MNQASRSSWQNSPLPNERENFDYFCTFDEPSFNKLISGYIPSEMEDKWFVFFEDGWLYFHRSWTGICIYALRLDVYPDGASIAESLVNRNFEQYQSTSIDNDMRLVRSLIEDLLLSKDIPF